MHTGPQEPMNRFSERRRSPLWVKSTHYRAAALLSASPQSTDISAIGGHLLAPSWTEFQASLLAVRVIPGLR